jgi:hypothetical protein
VTSKAIVAQSHRRAAQFAGEKFYFTGKVCVNGHVDLRREGDGECVSCRRLIHEQRHVENGRGPNRKTRHMLVALGMSLPTVKANGS